MPYNVLILSEAEHDLDDAFIWYELNQIGLGKRFYESVDLYWKQNLPGIIPDLKVSRSLPEEE